MNTDIHGSAKALIIKAAEDSGLLREVAELLWFAEKYGGGDKCCTGGSCAPCELLDRLVEEFEGLAHLPETVVEKTFSPACPEAITIAARQIDRAEEV